MGLTYAGFIAPIIARILPWVGKLPISALHSDAHTKKIVDRLTMALIEGRIVNDNAHDVLTLMRMAYDDVQNTNRLNEKLLADITTLM